MLRRTGGAGKKKSRHVIDRSYWVRKAPPDVAQLWPGFSVQLAVCRIRYEPRHPGWKVRDEETHFYLLVGPPGAKPYGAKRVAALIRGHWGIENRLNHVKDRTLREDDQQVRCGAMALCWLRTVALTLLQRSEERRRVGGGRKKRRRYLPEIRSEFAAHPGRAVKLLGAS